MTSEKYEWINIDKYLPPFCEPVLAVIEHHEDIGATEVYVCELHENGYWILGFTYEDPRDITKISALRAAVTHWMRLPLPPASHPIYSRMDELFIKAGDAGLTEEEKKELSLLILNLEK